MYCTNCGLQISKGDKFCGKCGTKISEKGDINSYSQEELAYRADAAYQLLKRDLRYVTSKIDEGIKEVLENSEYKKISQKKENVLLVELMAFLIFYVWNLSFKMLKEENAKRFNTILSNKFKNEIGIRSDAIFEQYCQPKPEKNFENEMTWLFWLFGKAVAKTLNYKNNPFVILSVSPLMPLYNKIHNRHFRYVIEY